MDTVYPQPIRLKLGATPRRKKRESENRYRTQPVTFSEIKEVDEENTAEEEVVDPNRRMSAESGGVLNSKSSTSVNAHFEELFARRRGRKMNKKLQNKFDFSKQTSIISSIPASPQNGVEDIETVNTPLKISQNIEKENIT